MCPPSEAETRSACGRQWSQGSISSSNRLNGERWQGRRRGGDRDKYPETWEPPSFFLSPALGEACIEGSGRRNLIIPGPGVGLGGRQRGGDIGGVLVWGL